MRTSHITVTNSSTRFAALQHPISNQQSAISNQQSAISNQQSAINIRNHRRVQHQQEQTSGRIQNINPLHSVQVNTAIGVP
jgi:hypothetical protein